MAEPYEDTWSDFSVFAGDSALTPTLIFANGTTLRESVNAFYTWLDGFHTNLLGDKDVGIDAQHKDDVLKLLKAFFPLPEAPKAVRKPPMIRMIPPPMPKPGETVSSQPQLDPVEVAFGVGKIPIIDGPAALAYIFSVAQPPTYLGNPPADLDPKPSLVRQWVLPLLAALSRCIYLAYIYEEIRGTDPYGNNKGNVMVVPLMSCAMWVVDGQPGSFPHYLLGSTYVTGSNAGVAGVEALQKRRLMNAWRKETLLDPPLASFAPPRVVPPTTDPQFFMAPILQKEVEKLLLSVLRSDSLANGNIGDLNRLLISTLPPLDELSEKPWFTIDQTIVNTAVNVAKKAMREPYEAIKPPLPPIDAIDRDMILANEKATLLRTTLRQALSSVMRIVWGNQGVLPTQQDDINMLEAAFKELFSVYYVPHYYLVKSDPATQTTDLDFTAEVPIPTRLVAAEVLWTALWTTETRDNMFQMAHRIYWWVFAEEESLKFANGLKPRFGRCAETHPVSGLMPTTCAARRLASQNPSSSVYGLAMEIRAFTNGQSSSLGPSFTWGMLTKVNDGRKQGLFRLPCANCKVLLPALDVLVGKETYDAELYRRNPDFADARADD